MAISGCELSGCPGKSLVACRVPVTVTTIYRDENEVAAARGGENLRLRLSGVDEEDIQAGFVICSRNCPVSHLAPM